MSKIDTMNVQCRNKAVEEKLASDSE